MLSTCTHMHDGCRRYSTVVWGVDCARLPRPWVYSYSRCNINRVLRDGNRIRQISSDRLQPPPAAATVRQTAVSFQCFICRTYPNSFGRSIVHVSLGLVFAHTEGAMSTDIAGAVYLRSTMGLHFMSPLFELVCNYRMEAKHIYHLINYYSAFTPNANLVAWSCCRQSLVVRQVTNPLR